MTLALRSPKLLGALIPVDNAPVDANLKNDFHKYVQAMRNIEEKEVKKQAEADAILKSYEEVSNKTSRGNSTDFLTHPGITHTAVSSH